VFFVGDAAKVVSPFGARGGNTGIADAENLAWKLAAVLKGRAAPALLETYHDERHEAARQNVMVTNRTARFLRPASATEKLFRDAALGLARQYPFARQLVNTGRMAIANPYTNSPACCEGGGQPLQNVALQWADGSAGTMNDLLRWADGRLLLLLFGALDLAALRRVRALAESAPLVALQVVGTRGEPLAVEHVLDPESHLHGACHVFGHTWALVRPDAYVAATGENVDAALVNALAKCLGAEQVES
jgi:3-(3-hydroxy-phenyl)propionate hydroxylase